MISNSATIDDLLAHAAWLRTLARRLVRDEATAEDLVQETWLAALIAQPELEGLGSWLGRVTERLARHRSRGELRRRRREQVAAQDRLTRTDAEVHEAFEIAREFACQVDDLPEPYRTLILRRYYDGYTASELARKEGIPPATVRSQLARARALLRNSWKRSGDHQEMRSIAGLVLLAGISPKSIGTVTIMKASHIGIVCVTIALLFLGALKGGLLVGPEPYEDGDPAHGTVLVSDTESAADEEGLLNGPAKSTDRQAIGPAVPAVASNTTEPSATRLLARIVDADQRPIAGATLDSPRLTGFGEAESDDAGLLVLVAAAESIPIWRGQPTTRECRITAKGHATRFLEVAMTPFEDTDLGDLVLAPGGSIAGRVVDEKGVRIAGVKVVLTRSALGGPSESVRLTGPPGDTQRIEGVTGADGSYHIEGAGVGEWRVWAQQQGRPWAFTSPIGVRPRTVTQADDIELVAADPSVVIAGTVVDPAGAPIAGAVVVGSDLGEGRIRYTRAVADELGRFRLMGLDRGPHRIAAYHPKAELTPTYRNRVEPGRDEIVLRLTEQRWCTVQILDDTNGAPVEKPWINVDNGGGMNLANMAPTADEQDAGPGALRFALPEGPFVVTASAKGYRSTTLESMTPGTLDENLEVRLTRKPMISGRVIAAGQPVAGARVQTMRDISATLGIQTAGFRTRLFDGGMFAATTDEDGRFEHPASTSVPKGAHIVRASKEGWASAEVVVEVDTTGAHGIEIELTAGGVIEGRVMLPHEQETRGGVVAASNGDGSVVKARTDREGAYRLEHLAHGPWEVRYREEDQAFSTFISAEPDKDPYSGDCEVREGEVTRHDLDLRHQTKTIAGTLRFDAAPAVGWTARLQDTSAVPSKGAANSQKLDAAGAFQLESNQPSISLVVESPDERAHFVRMARPIDPTEDASTLVVEVVTGRITGRAKRAAKLRFSAALESGWSFQLDLTTAADGTFNAEVPAGAVQLQIEESELGKFTRFVDAKRVEVPAGASTSVDLRGD